MHRKSYNGFKWHFKFRFSNKIVHFRDYLLVPENVLRQIKKDYEVSTVSDTFAMFNGLMIIKIRGFHDMLRKIAILRTMD